MPTLNDIRSTFLNYYARQGHKVLPSSPLVPRNDPTLMFVNSGMVQFKNLFTGVETQDYTRATTAQKCVRAGGKHNDLDNVGYTARHHTFFEMMGNFSFGDYFKQEAISYAWEMLTKELCIPKEKLIVTVYHDDDEAVQIWKSVAGLSDDKIIRIKTDDNFWMMGSTGPCGPSSEVFYDHGDHIWGGPPGSPEEDGDRFVEIWNLVFMQFEQFEDGTRAPLSSQSIDTGMGIERVAALLQGTNDNYSTDLMRNLIEASADATSSDPDGPDKTHHRVIADHLRSTSFLIADGVLPSKDGRGYVLRRIMRRAMRHAHLIGAEDPLLHRLVPSLVQQMGAAYPELVQAQAMIEETLLQEETRFRTTLDRGLKLLEGEISKLRPGGSLPGKTAFKLYDTFGFPLDLTQDALREQKMAVDTEGFDAAMSEQKIKARAAWSGSGEIANDTIWYDIFDTHGATEFLGYDTEQSEGQLLALVQGDEKLQIVSAGATVQLIFNQTPFYAESGGQVGDTGQIKTDTGCVKITDTRKSAEIVIHMGTVLEGTLTIGQPAELEVNQARRNSIRANHSATHLLHEALRRSLGEHVAQRGSLNSHDRLRFDFSHGHALTPEQLEEVQGEVNNYIRQNTTVETRVMTPDAARELGAQALFGEKYGDEVRVISMGNLEGSKKGASANTYSLELCGGTHVRQTGDIGSFILLGDAASSAGVRRVEAVTGSAAITYIQSQQSVVLQAASTLKVQPAELAVRAQQLLDERKNLKNEITDLRRNLAMSSKDGTNISDPINVAGNLFLAQVLQGVTGRDLPTLVDSKKVELGSGAVLLIAENDGKTAVAAGVTDDLTDIFSAVDMVKVAVAELGGKGGGGRADMAQGGAKSAKNADLAVAAVKKLLEG
jgi:alanyl-tRNA synthetase|tara:strand:+ start:3488 stop:6148 length:2661 start_codon:yes stop_codon:yes gene_type:complete